MERNLNHAHHTKGRERASLFVMHSVMRVVALFLYPHGQLIIALV
jgi:hypothetical protein